MTVAIALEHADLVGPGLRWPLRIAALREGDLVLFVPARTKATVNLSDPAGAPAWAPTLAEALDTHLGADAWRAKESGGESTAEAGARLVRVELVPRESLVDRALGVLQNRASDALVFVSDAHDGEDDWWQQSARAFLGTTTCEIVFVEPGKRETDGELMAAAAAGPNARAAIQLAADLGSSQDRRVVALYAEPDIGPEAASVGRRVLDRVVRAALGDRSVEVRRRVAVANRVENALLAVVGEEQYEVLLLGTSRHGAMAANARSIGQRVRRKTDQPTLVFVRARTALAGVLLRHLDGAVQRWVPQLGRDGRTDLVDRVQPNVEWNFDFILLVALSTLIAALGLLDNSAAVIIGAMLVAPLMTPLLGIGLALTQGNPLLAKMSLKAVGLGFVTAFLMAVCLGLAAPEFVEATPEMAARDWPQLLDLVIAFVSGLAAAYASGRPGLIAALPGVAIAAALLPPIATSGLALAIGDVDLSLGAALLFLVNMVAIVLAAACALWAVGVRRLRAHTRTTRAVGTGLGLAAVILMVLLALAPPQLAPPKEFVQAVEATLDEGIRLRHVYLRQEAEGPVAQIDLGGIDAPRPSLAQRLNRLAREHLGEDYGVRLTYRYEVLVR